MRTILRALPCAILFACGTGDDTNVDTVAIAVVSEGPISLSEECALAWGDNAPRLTQRDFTADLSKAGGCADAARAALVSNPDIIVGPYSSTCAIAMEEALKGSGIPWISPTATNDQLTHADSDCFNRTVPNNAQQVAWIWAELVANNHDVLIVIEDPTDDTNALYLDDMINELELLKPAGATLEVVLEDDHTSVPVIANSLQALLDTYADHDIAVIPLLGDHDEWLVAMEALATLTLPDTLRVIEPEAYTIENKEEGAIPDAVAARMRVFGLTHDAISEGDTYGAQLHDLCMVLQGAADLQEITCEAFRALEVEGALGDTIGFDEHGDFVSSDETAYFSWLSWSGTELLPHISAW